MQEAARVTTWQNRIIGEGEEAPDQLLANPANFRVHPKAQQDALADVLADVGVVQRVIVNQRTGRLVDGHLRVALALRQNQPTIPVLYVDLDEREEALVLATLDPIAAMATTDAEKLDALLRDVHTDSAALQTMLDELTRDAGMYGAGMDDLAPSDFDATMGDEPLSSQWAFKLEASQREIVQRALDHARLSEKVAVNYWAAALTVVAAEYCDAHGC